MYNSNFFLRSTSNVTSPSDGSTQISVSFVRMLPRGSVRNRYKCCFRFSFPRTKSAQTAVTSLVIYKGLGTFGGSYKGQVGQVGAAPDGPVSVWGGFDGSVVQKAPAAFKVALRRWRLRSSGLAVQNICTVLPSRSRQRLHSRLRYQPLVLHWLFFRRKVDSD